MTESPQGTTPIELKGCVLLRLFAIGKSVSRDQLTDALGPFFIGPLNLREEHWGELLETVIGELKRDRLISFASNQTTKLGREALCEFLDASAPPPNDRWTALRNQYLIAKALGVYPDGEAERKRLGTAEGLRVGILVQGHQLSISPFVRMSECLDELARRQFAESPNGMADCDGAFARDQVLSSRLMKGLPGKPERVLPMMLTGASDDSPETLRLALLQKWVRQSNGVEESTHAASEFDMTVFSHQVRHAAQLVNQPRYGESKVFILHVWDVFRKQIAGPEWSLDEFKNRLVEANRENLLTLSRADLVGVMDRQLIQASEIRLPHATFHFVRLQTDS